MSEVSGQLCLFLCESIGIRLQICVIMFVPIKSLKKFSDAHEKKVFVSTVQSCDITASLMSGFRVQSQSTIKALNKCHAHLHHG